MNQMRMMQMSGGDPTGGGRCLAYLMKYQCFRKNYMNYIQFKVFFKNYLTQYLMSMVMITEKIVDKQCLPKKALFPIRGLYPVYLIANVML